MTSSFQCNACGREWQDHPGVESCCKLASSLGESLLLDPHAVFLNFLHGKIAKLDWAKLEHIHGPHPALKERDEARGVACGLAKQAERLRKERDEALKALREIAEAIGFDNIGDWARNTALKALEGAK